MAKKAKPQFMTDLKVNFVSLVDRGANKRKFAIFKSAEAETIEIDENGNSGKESSVVVKTTDKKPVEKYGELEVIIANPPTSFGEALAAQEAQQKLEISRYTMDEYFYLLRCVLKSIAMSPSIPNKKSAIEKTIDEFRVATTKLFDGLPVAKQAELFNKEGENMATTNGSASADGAVTEVSKATGSKSAGDSDISQNGQPDAQSRTSQSDDVEGVTAAAKKKAEMKKQVETEIEKAKKQLEDEEKAYAKKKEEMKKSLESLEVKKTEIEKADMEVKGDGVSTNGVEGTTAPDHKVDAGDVKVTKSAAELGAENPKIDSPAPAKQDVALSGDQISGIVETFRKQIEVTLEGKLGAMKDMVMKEVGTLIEEKVSSVEKQVTSIQKMGGLSNALDFDNESERGRSEVSKSEDKEWSGAMDGFGSIRRSK